MREQSKPRVERLLVTKFRDRHFSYSHSRPVIRNYLVTPILKC